MINNFNSKSSLSGLVSLKRTLNAILLVVIFAITIGCSSGSSGNSGNVSGNSSDTTPPVVTAPGNITVTATSSTGTSKTDTAIVAFLAGASAFDDVDGDITDITNDAPATFPIGKTTVTFSATDTAGNVGTATADVTVAAYSQTDLVGTWELESMASGPGAPWWQRGLITGGSDGSFAFIGEERGQAINSSTKNGTWSLGTDGLITLDLTGQASQEFGYVDLGKTLFVLASTWDTSQAGTSEVWLTVKKGSSYTPSDWSGRWVFHTVAGGDGAPWWLRHTYTIAADGSAMSEMTYSDGTADSPSFNNFNTDVLHLASDGMVTHALNTSAEGAMDADKTLVIMTSDWQTGTPNTTDISIGMKMADTYSPSDLYGKWTGYAIKFGAIYIEQKTISVFDANGTSVEEFDSSGALINSSTSTTPATIGSNGIDTSAPSGEDSMCSLDIGKTVLACTRTEQWNSDNTPKVVVLTVMVKVSN